MTNDITALQELDSLEIPICRLFGNMSTEWSTV
jgi:hypothetical protein